LYLLLGHSQDDCCKKVNDALVARNFPVRMMQYPLTHGSRFSLWLDNEKSVSQLAWDQNPPVPDNQIAGVLVRSYGWIDPEGWQLEDFPYVQAETQAALLAWLWSLDCPVVNRYPSKIWFQPQVPLLSWQRLLRQCNLPTQETIVTNVEQEARAYGKRSASDEDWSRLADVQRITPICLTYPHGEAQFVCVAGERVVWEGEPSFEVSQIERGLRCFARAAGLAFVELAFAPTSEGNCVIAVEPKPHFEHFGELAQEQIVEGLVDLLTAGSAAGNK
jgi:hypothetical protein